MLFPHAPFRSLRSSGQSLIVVPKLSKYNSSNMSLIGESYVIMVFTMGIAYLYICEQVTVMP